MQTKHLCVLIHIWIKGEVGAPLNWFKPSSKIFYWPFQGGTSFMDLLCFFLSCVCYYCTRLFICALWSSPVGKGLTSWLSFVVSYCEFVTSHWYPGSGVVLDFIDSWSLHPYLLCTLVCVIYREYLKKGLLARVNIRQGVSLRCCFLWYNAFCQSLKLLIQLLNIVRKAYNSFTKWHVRSMPKWRYWYLYPYWYNACGELVKRSGDVYGSNIGHWSLSVTSSYISHIQTFCSKSSSGNNKNNLW